MLGPKTKPVDVAVARKAIAKAELLSSPLSDKIDFAITTIP